MIRAASVVMPGEQRVDGADQDVRRVSARDAGERRGQTSQRMAADRPEHDRRQRDQHDVAHLGRRVGNDRREHDDRRQQVPRRAQDQRPQQRAEEAGALGDADPEQGDEDRAQRREPGEVRHQVHRDPPHPLRVHQADRADRPVLGAARDAGGPRVVDLPAERLRQPRDQQDEQSQDGKQRHRVRQQVAEELDRVQEASEQAGAASLSPSAPLRSPGHSRNSNRRPRGKARRRAQKVACRCGVSRAG